MIFHRVRYILQKCLIVMFLAVFPLLTVHADMDPEDKKLDESLNYKQDVVSLMDKSVVVKPGVKFRYLSPEDAEKVLVDGWGNPPTSPDEPSLLGMIVPADTSPFDDKGWGAELFFESDSYISDEDANSIDYDLILKDMKKSNIEENKVRERHGYEALHLIGWAEPPHYDPSSHTIYWALRLHSKDSGEFINYYIRNLGRYGVFNINIIASAEQLPTIKKEASNLLKIVSFAEGHRYQDRRFWDTTSTYTLGALVAGGAAVAAKKVGMLGLVILFVKKFFVVIIAAFAVLAKFLFGRKKS
ncbi:DUF2167 domain-containing protein [Buttiauxella sp. 3AFRM03]|uniref:DUF2167 domain-containing protein n=1 Tax=Buttiauxella sp. 3AFRM03 TaxID=2479367 RepID=UPI000EF780AF|nr:DUF2167 domain-containing protein [Buttiauxella sp. 3AFRM03]AYN29190.1 DUF2167 domain-containing protein [Buttiauxella sp. 3AFRM03]